MNELSPYFIRRTAVPPHYHTEEPMATLEERLNELDQRAHELRDFL